MSRSTSPGRRAVALTLVAAWLVLGACSGSRPELSDDSDATTSTSTTAPAPLATVAQAVGDTIEVFPDATAEAPTMVITAADATAAPDIPIVFLVRTQQAERLEVNLPTAPPGGIGWIRRSDVDLATVAYRIEVTLAEHRIRLYEGHQLLIDEPIAVGPERPEPGGAYYLKELLQPPDQSGPYGAYAYGLSGYDTDLTSFATGTGMVALTGTDAAETLGQDAARGAISLSNETISRFVVEVGLPLGTPVAILA